MMFQGGQFYFHYFLYYKFFDSFIESFHRQVKALGVCLLNI